MIRTEANHCSASPFHGDACYEEGWAPLSNGEEFKMKPTTKHSVSVAILCLALSGLAVRAQNLISNGDFELPGSDSTPGGQILRDGDTSISAWTVTDYGWVFPPRWWITTTFPPSINTGRYAVDLTARAAISTTFPTVSNTIYEVSFWVIAFGDEAQLEVRVGGISTDFTTLKFVGTNLTMRFIAERTEPSATLEFINAAEAFDISPSYVVDTVSVIARPDLPHLTIEVSQVSLCWDSLATQMYQIQYRSELTANTWVDLGTPIAGNGATNCITDAVTGPRRFYRVVVRP
jgi:hypothetical protein